MAPRHLVHWRLAERVCDRSVSLQLRSPVALTQGLKISTFPVEVTNPGASAGEFAASSCSRSLWLIGSVVGADWKGTDKVYLSLARFLDFTG